MANEASFVVRLIDRVTAPARTASASVKGLNKSLKSIKKSSAFQALDKGADKVIGFAKNAAIMGGAVAAAVGVGITAAVIEASDSTQKMRKAFELLTGSAALGNQAWAESLKLSQDLGIGLDESSQAMRKLLAAQFSIGESSELIKMVNDLKAVGVEGEETKRVLMAISQIKAKGKLQAEEMLQLAEAGVSLELVYNSLQKATGKTREEIQSMQQKGEVTSALGLDAIRDAVKEKLHVKDFGTTAAKQSVSTISGLIGRVHAAWTRMLVRITDATGPVVDVLKPAFQSIEKMLEDVSGSEFADFIKDMLDNLVKLVPLALAFVRGFAQGAGQLLSGVSLDLDAGSIEMAANAGREFAKALGTLLSIVKLAGRALAWLATPTGAFIAKGVLLLAVFVKVVGFIMSAVVAIKWLGAAFMAIKSIGGILFMLKMIGLVVIGLVSAFPLLAAAVVAAIAGIGYAIYAWWDEITAFFAGVYEAFFEVGGNLIRGMVDGIRAGVGAVVSAVSNLASSAINTAKGILNINSPSKVFEEIGMFTGEGFVRGVDWSSADAQAAMASMAQAPAFRGGGSQSISLGGINVTVNGSDANAQDIGEAVAASVIARLGPIMGTRAMAH